MTATHKLGMCEPVLIKSWFWLSSKTWNTSKPYPTLKKFGEVLFSLLSHIYQHNLISGNNLWDGNSNLGKFQRCLFSWYSSLAGNRNYCPPADEREPNPERFTVQIPAQKHLICLDRLPISSWTLCAGMISLSESFEVCPTRLLMYINITAEESQPAAHSGIIILK